MSDTPGAVNQETAGQPPLHKTGWKHTAESIEKMRQAKLGKKASDATKEKMSKSRLGKVVSEATKAKIRAANSERLRKVAARRIGKPLSELTKQRLAKSKMGHTVSRECRDKIALSLVGRFAGDNSPSWKGGITPLNAVIRASFTYRQWRSDVFTRDDFTCRDCGARGGNLHAHHSPKTFSAIVDEYKITTMEQAESCSELWNLNNGITLCADCHLKRHRGDGHWTRAKGQDKSEGNNGDH